MAKRNRNDPVYNGYYARFMGRGRLMNNQTDNRQMVLENMYRRVLGELCMNRFEWKGFEGTGVDVRYMEMMLYMHALSVVFQDNNIINSEGEITRVGTGQIYALRGSASGRRNLVDNPVSFTLSGPNFQGRVVSYTDCVPVWANYFRYPDTDIVDIYAHKLADLDRTIEINAHNARRSKVLTYNENSRLTAKNINEMIDRGEATIPVNAQLGELVSALDMGIDPKSVETLSVLRSRLWNECMGMLGINNSNQDKKERLVEAEVGANDDQVASARRVNLNARQDAARLINERFGLSVSVDYYTDMPTEQVDPLTAATPGEGV